MLRSHNAEVCTGGVDHAGFVHYIFMWHIAVRKDDLFRAILLDEIKQFFLGSDGDSARVQVTSQLFGIEASFNVGNLGGGKSYNFVILIPSEKCIEVVKIAPCGAHNDGFDRHRKLLCMSQ